MQDYNQLHNEWSECRQRLMSETPDMMKSFGGFHENVIKDGALPSKTKELIALSLGVAARCDPCIAVHTKKCIELGASRQEMLESGWVSVVMGGGPALMYMKGLVKAMDDFGAK
jgi:AhpD family alkylhydroperoxidase